MEENKHTAADRVEAITSLIEKLEGASEGSRELDWLIADATGHPSFAKKIEGLWPPFMERSRLDKDVPAYSTSIDAALALAERSGLDGWKTLYTAIMSWKGHDPRGPLSTSLPLALCAAILRAKASNPEGEA